MVDNTVSQTMQALVEEAGVTANGIVDLYEDGKLEMLGHEEVRGT
jgi:hypothetical protein